jgi:hypothetical protein
MRNAEGFRCYLLSASSVAVFNRSGSRHACTKSKAPSSVVRSRRTDADPPPAEQPRHPVLAAARRDVALVRIGSPLLHAH